MQSLHYQSVFAPILFRYDFQSKAKTRSEADVISEKMESIVRECLQSGAPVQSFFNENIASLFELRIASLRWLIKNRINIDDFPLLVEDALEVLRKREGFSVFCDNVEFAVRANIKGILKVLPDGIKHIKKEGRVSFADIEQIPQISWNDYLNVLGQSIPSPIFSLMLDWIMASLAIEFATLSALIIGEKNLQPLDSQLEEFAAFAANAGHEFGAISREIAAQAFPSPPNIASLATLTASEIEEQQLLAELGMAEYSEELSQHE